MIGVDIEQISRFNGWTASQQKRIFSESEILYASKQKNPSEHFCGFYCVKEALTKALDNKNLTFKNIEVLHTKTNKPYINVNQEIASILNEINKTKIEISISHAGEYAIAVVQIN